MLYISMEINVWSLNAIRIKDSVDVFDGRDRGEGRLDGCGDIVQRANNVVTKYPYSVMMVMMGAHQRDE